MSPSQTSEGLEAAYQVERPVGLSERVRRGFKDQNPEAILRQLEEYGLRVTLPPNTEPLEDRTRAFASNLFMNARDAGWRATEAAALISPSILVPLLLPGKDFRSADRSIRRFAAELNPPLSAYEALREKALVDERQGRLMNRVSARRNGSRAEFSGMDNRRGIRIHPYDGVDSLLLSYFYGILFAKGNVDNASTYTLGIGITEKDRSFFAENVEMVVYHLFHANGRQPRRFLISSKAVYTHLRDDLGIIREQVVEAGQEESGIGSKKIAGTILPLRESTLWPASTEEIGAYIAGIIGVKGVARRKERRQPRIEFNDGKERSIPELEWAIETLGVACPTEQLKGGQRWRDRRYLNPRQILLLADSPAPRFLPRQQGYLTHPDHLALLPELRAAAAAPAAHSSFRMYCPSRS